MARKELFADELVPENGEQTIEIVTGPKAMEAAEMEAFMNEKVNIIIHDSQSEDDLKVVVLSVNGINHPVMRGEETPVKRFFVESLARAKTTHNKQLPRTPENADRNDLIPRVSLSYPFSIIEDRNPKGGQWLRAILGERSV